MEQGFNIYRRPSVVGDVPLTINLKIGGRLRMVSEGGDQIGFFRGAWSVIRYGGLRVIDSRGKILSARLSTSGRVVHVIVDDRRAHYPLIVDPSFYTVMLAGPVRNPETISDIP